MATRTALEPCPDSGVLEGFALHPQEAGEVAGHVAQCAACQSRLERIEQDNDLLREFLSATAARRPESAVPVIDIPGYTLVRELHRGGQGVVYLAKQESTQRQVAVKIMREGPLAGLAERTRFQREVETLVQLEHPNIVTIHDSGRVLGWNYFVMDYVRGAALDEHVRAQGDHGSTRRATVELLATICEAVNAAHVRGIIHRDLKPGNILVGADNRPHILDFGLAKAESSQGETMTGAGQFVGSLPWSSPEQVAGAPQRIDIRSDVYALGVIAYQLLTGEFPYDVSGGVAEVAGRIRTLAPVSLRSRRRGIDADLETMIIKCLSKEPDRRYQSAGELARDLRRYLADEPIEARRDSTWYVLSKHLKRHRLPLAAGAISILALVIFSIALTFAYQRVRTAERDSHHKSAELAHMLRDSNIERGRLLGVQGAVPLAEKLLWAEFLTTSTSDIGVESTDPAFWALAELYARHPCLRTTRVNHQPVAAPPLPIRAPENHRIDVYEVSGDARTCAVGLRSGDVAILERADGAYSRELLRFSAADSKIRRLAWMNDDASLLSLSWQGQLTVWDGIDRAEPVMRWTRTGVIGGGLVAVDPSSRRIAVQDFVNQAILFLDGQNGATLGASDQADLLIGGTCAFDHGATRFAYTPANNSGIRIYDVPDGRLLATLRGHHASVKGLEFSADARQLESTDDDGVRKTWELPGHQRAFARVSREMPAPEVVQVASAPDDETMIGSGTVMAAAFDTQTDDICFADDSGWLWITDRIGAQVLHAFRADGAAVSGLAFSPDGARLATCGYSGTPQLWDRATLQLQRQLRTSHGQAFTHVAFAPAGDKLALACQDHCVYIWDLTANQQQRLSEHTASVSVAEYSPDGRWLASADRGGELILRAAAGHQVRFRVRAHGIIRILAFSADSRLLATAGDDRQIRLWDVETGTLCQTITGHQQAVYALAFHPRGDILAAGDAGGAIILWDARAGARLLQFDRHAGSIFSMEFASDGCRLVSASGDRTAVVHDICYLEHYLAGNAAQAIDSEQGDAPASRIDAIRRWAYGVLPPLDSE